MRDKVTARTRSGVYEDNLDSERRLVCRRMLRGAAIYEQLPAIWAQRPGKSDSVYRIRAAFRLAEAV